MAARFCFCVEDIDSRDAQRFSGADQVGSRDHYCSADGAEIIDLQFGGSGIARAVAEVIFDGVPGGFVGDGSSDAAVEHAVAN